MQTTKKKSRQVKKDLWNVFDAEIPNSKKKIECVYQRGTEREFCDACKSTLFISDEGYLACTNDKCGIIYTDILDLNAEWRYYGGDDNQGSDPTRCGMPVNPLLKESSYGCKVLCNGKTSWEMKKIRKYTEWQSMPYKEKSQYDEFQRITIIAQNAGISKMIINDAMTYYKKISEHKTFRGLNRDGIIAASIYIALRTNNNPRTAREIAMIFTLDNSSATKGCKNALVIVNELESEMHNDEKTTLTNLRPDVFIERYCSKLNINKELTQLCCFIAVKIFKQNLIPENTPHSCTAGIIYFISQTCNLNIKKSDIFNITGISEVTINKCYKKLEQYKEQLLPKAILAKYID